MKKIGIHIFRRDLRIQDNTALNELAKSVDEIIPVFIFTPQQLEKNDYKSNNAVQFLYKSLQELDAQIGKKSGKLFILYGELEIVLAKLVQKIKPVALSYNKDYTVFSQKRDSFLNNFCIQNKIACIATHDALLNPPGAVLKPDKNPYTIFTPFRKKAQQLLVPTPITSSKIKFSNIVLEIFAFAEEKKIAPLKNKNIRVQGGRTEALNLLVDFLTKVRTYQTDRDFPDKPGTSYLSAHLKFGTISVREVFWEIFSVTKGDSTFLHELYWRDFFTHIVYFFPKVFGNAFKQKYDQIEWSNRLDFFEAWKSGKTGFPLIDAGMRELNKTGYMHNRVRMIVASFLVKDLHIDWRWGEKYFAQKLVDYDPSINNGNWQWAASTGCDAQPYFRIFNPWRQQERFDANAQYIKKWVPELLEVPAKEIHKLGVQKSLFAAEYPSPIVDHKKQSETIKQIFKDCS